ncbi:MAG: hypothetical protein HY313_07970 [Acidobacteria bacterium]|nr:hypothetical protein [Acidobacteriota bacterium]
MGFLTKQSAVLLPCDPGLLYEVLTDYDSYAEWMPFVARSKLLARERDLALAEFELLHPAKDVFVVECIHTKNKMVLWRAIRGRIPLSEAQWDIEPAEGGQVRVRLTFQTNLNWGLLRPAYSRFLKTAPCLNALRMQISAFLPELAPEEGEKILEIAETSEGTICWMLGKKYILTPAP